MHSTGSAILETFSIALRHSPVYPQSAPSGSDLARYLSRGLSICILTNGSNHHLALHPHQVGSNAHKETTANHPFCFRVVLAPLASVTIIMAVSILERASSRPSRLAVAPNRIVRINTADFLLHLFPLLRTQPNPRSPRCTSESRPSVASWKATRPS